MGTLCLLVGTCTRTPTYGRILHLRAITFRPTVNLTFDCPFSFDHRSNVYAYTHIHIGISPHPIR